MNRAGIVCMAAVCSCLKCFSLSVQAAPATLTSPDAAVYEQADEESRQVGNLVEGSAFEYTGDVTAEDGSVWHQVTTASGINGYIRGDREIEIEESAAGGQEASNEENESAAAGNVQEGGGGADAGNEQEGGGGADAGNEQEGGGGADAGNVQEGGGGADAGNVQEGGGEGADTGEALGEDAGENEGLSEENEDLEENDTVQAAMSGQNNQTKKYVLDPSGKIKERESLADPDGGIQNVERTKAGTDMTLPAGMAVVLFCAVAIHICLTGMRRIKWEAEGGGMPEEGKGRLRRKTEKKKHSQKRKESRPGTEKRHESGRRKKQQAAGRGQ